MPEADQFWRYAKEAVLATYYAESDDEKQSCLTLRALGHKRRWYSGVLRSIRAAAWLSLRKAMLAAIRRTSLAGS